MPEAKIWNGTVKCTYDKDRVGLIQVSLFASPSTGIAANDVWMPFVNKVDANGFGFHSMPKVGDSVLVIQYGNADNCVATYNFWGEEKSVYQRKDDEYSITYPTIDTNKEFKPKDLKKSDDVIKSVTRKWSKNENESLNLNLLENIYSYKTKYFQFVIDETNKDAPTFVCTNQNKSFVFQMSNEGLYIYNKDSINFYSGNELNFAAAKTFSVLANNVNMQSSGDVVIASQGKANLRSSENIEVIGKQIKLNCKSQDASQSNIKSPVIEQGEPIELSGASCRVSVKVPYGEKFDEYFILRNYDKNNELGQNFPLDRGLNKINLNVDPGDPDYCTVSRYYPEPENKQKFNPRSFVYNPSSLIDAEREELINFYNKLVSNLSIKSSKDKDGKVVIDVQISLNKEMFDVPAEVPDIDELGNWSWTNDTNSLFYNWLIERGEKPGFTFSKINGGLVNRLPLTPLPFEGTIRTADAANSQVFSNGFGIKINKEIIKDFIVKNKLNDPKKQGTLIIAGDKNALEASLENPLAQDAKGGEQASLDAKGKDSADAKSIYLNYITLQDRDFQNSSKPYAMISSKSYTPGKPLSLDVDLIVPSQVKWMDIQLVRRATNATSSEDHVTQMMNISYYPAGADGYHFKSQPNYNDVKSGTIPQAEVRSNYTTGDAEERNGLLEYTAAKETNGEVPRFSFFLDKDRRFGFDSFVRVHNLYKFAPTLGAHNIDHVFHNETSGLKRMLHDNYVEEYKPAGKTELGTSSYTVYDGKYYVPVENDGGRTLVIDISDQFHRALLATALLGAPALLAGGAAAGAKLFGGETQSESLFIDDITESYKQSFDGSAIGVISSDFGSKTSQYYYGTMLSVSGAFDSSKAGSKFNFDKILNSKFTFSISVVENGRTRDITKKGVDSYECKDHDIGGVEKAEDKKKKCVEIKIEDIVNDEYKKLPIGTYLVKIVNGDNVAGIVFDIIAPNPQIIIRDATDFDDPVNKPLISQGYGSISVIDGGLYSRYRHGTHVSLKVSFEFDVAKELGDDSIKQSWMIGIYTPDDKNLLSPVWQSEELMEDENGETPIVELRDPKDPDQWQKFEYGDYVVVANGIIRFGEVQVNKTAKLILSYRNSLALYDESQKTELGKPGDGLYQPIIATDKDISGSITNQSADGSFYKGGTYYADDFKNLAIWLRFSDGGEHEYIKKLVEVSTGDEIPCDIQDKYDAETGGYRIGLKSQIADGYYKLTIISKESEDMKDDILFRLYGSAEIVCTPYSRAYISASKHYNDFGEFTAVMSYFSSIKEDAKIVSYAILYNPNGEIITTIDGINTVLSGDTYLKKTDDTYSCDAISGLKVWKITPGKQVSYKIFSYSSQMGVIAKVDYVILGIESIASYKITMTIYDKFTGEPVTNSSTTAGNNSSGSTSGQSSGNNGSSTSGDNGGSSQNGNGSSGSSSSNNPSSSNDTSGQSSSSSGANSSATQGPRTNVSSTSDDIGSVADDAKQTGKKTRTSKSTGGSTKKG